MSKIAEQKALESYPICNCYNEQCMMQEDVNIELRIGYEEGYDKAMQDLLEKACDWLETKIICYSKREYEELTEDFKNYIEKS
jgi:hypothetical protein